MLQDELKRKLEEEELRTVSDSFGGTSLGGKAPSYSISSIADWLITRASELEEIVPLLEKFDNQEFRYVIQCLIRFSFLIELTNLKISSTKLKTRWLAGKIIKTNPTNFTNYSGSFEPGEDQRASSFDNCFEVFKKTCILIKSEKNINIIKKLCNQQSRSVSYEFIIKYINLDLPSIHNKDNITVTNFQDLEWLVKVRPVLNKNLLDNTLKKIKTKSYKTDRAQTGEEQTNRAKRWECLKSDFQQATIEECWSVERKLYEELINFEFFPQHIITLINELGIQGFITDDFTKCPVTLEKLSYRDFCTQSAHGESKFHVGHLTPLKRNGRHIGENIAWITNDGNRIQGDLTLEETRDLIKKIYEKYSPL